VRFVRLGKKFRLRRGRRLDRCVRISRRQRVWRIVKKMPQDQEAGAPFRSSVAARGGQVHATNRGRDPLAAVRHSHARRSLARALGLIRTKPLAPATNGIPGGGEFSCWRTQHTGLLPKGGAEKA